MSLFFDMDGTPNHGNDNNNANCEIPNLKPLLSPFFDAIEGALKKDADDSKKDMQQLQQEIFNN